MAVLLNGLPVVDGQLVVPRVGAWHADLVVQDLESSSGAATLEVDGVDWACTISRGGLWQDTLWTRVAAGAGGASKPVRAVHYTSTTMRAVLADLLRAGGEALAAASDATLLATNLPSWTQMALPMGTSIAGLINVFRSANAWRYLSDGTVWAGKETWPDSGLTDLVDFQDIAEEPQMGAADLAFDTVGKLRPGTLLVGRKVSNVTYKFDGEKIRARVLFED